MGYGFFSDGDDNNKGNNDPFEYLKLIISTFKIGILLANICVFPFFLAGRIISKIASGFAAQPGANPHQTGPPPPRPEVPPFSRQQTPPPPPPSPKPDPLEKYRTILGVKPTDNKEEIKRRYRILSQFCHPDKNSPALKDDAEEEFKKIAEAYTILYALAPEAPPKSKEQRARERRADAPKPKPEPQKPKPEPERPRQSNTQSAKPPPKPQAETANPKPQPNTKEATPQKETKERFPKVDVSGFSKPKYF
jgi:hypothetical protein